MGETVDILVANWNTLPFLKLLYQQVHRFEPKIQSELFIWDNASNDGSEEWIKTANVKYRLNNTPRSHADSLSAMVDLSEATYITFLDVDAFPIKEGWLDEAIAILQDEKIGAVGLSAGINQGHHRVFVHPSFCVFRRDLYKKLCLKPDIVHDFEKGTAFDVGEKMCSKLQDAGYELRFIGSTGLDISGWKNWPKVIHMGCSTPMLAEQRVDYDWLVMIGEILISHKNRLRVLGLWECFRQFVSESIALNPLCKRYIDDDFIFAGEILSAVSHKECKKLAQLARGQIVLEVGSHYGRSTIALASTAKSVFSVDWHRGDPHTGGGNSLPSFISNIERYNVREKIMLMIGRNEEVLPLLPEGFFDLVFIDSFHERDAVEKDMKSTIPLIKVGGFIAFHDYGDARFQGISEVVDTFAGSRNLKLDIVDHLAVIKL